MKLIARFPKEGKIQYRVQGYLTQLQNVQKNHPFPLHQSLVWVLYLLSVALCYIDRISPNFPPSHHVQESSRPVAEESPWEQKHGLFQMKANVLFTTVCLKKKQWKREKISCCQNCSLAYGQFIISTCVIQISTSLLQHITILYAH